MSDLIKRDMNSLQSDVDLLLNKDDCPDEVKKMLSEIKTGKIQNKLRS